MFTSVHAESISVRHNSVCMPDSHQDRASCIKIWNDDLLKINTGALSCIINRILVIECGFQF